MTDEDRRQLVHAGVALLVVPLRWLTEEQAAAMAGAAILLNWVVLPVTGLDRRIRRPGGPWVDGVKLYPVAVLAAILLFGNAVAAAGWAVLGIGDAASNVIGRRLGRPPFLGRADRSAVGSLAFLVTAVPAALAAHAWVAASAPTLRIGAAALAAGVAGAVAEVVTPRRLDDNVPICLAAAGAFRLALG